jgi:CO/xanthine dehydrogenase Mo-binding subunit
MTTLHGTAPAVDLFGTPEVRIEGRDKVSGRMQYTADIHRPNELWAAYATSPYAFAKIVKIDTTAALAVEGVRAVLTSADIGVRRLGRNIYDWPVLAYEVVRFVGDRVAAVAAETREAAERAALLIEVEYEELKPVLDPFEALKPDAPILHPDHDQYLWKAYVGKTPPKRAHPNVQGGNAMRKGEADLEPIFAQAHRVFEHSFVTPRQHAGFIEPKSTVVWIDQDETVHVVTPNKQPFNVREQMSNVTGLPKEKIVVEPSAIGGDFGGKGLTLDEFSCYYLAKATGRPVRRVDSYTDELQGGTTRHRAYITLKTAVDTDGTFLAHHSTVIYDGGAYGAGKPGGTVTPGAGYTTVPYQVPNVKVDVTVVYTNTVPTAHVRSPGAPQLYFCWEQHADLMAEALGIDPLEFRLRNCVKQGDAFPTNEKIKDANAVMVLERLKQELKPLVPAPGRGRGYGLVVWHLGAGKTAVQMRLNADGSVVVFTGVPDQGAGAFTVVRRVAAAALGIAPDKVDVQRLPTDTALEDPGAGASRVTHIVGGATAVAAQKLIEKVAETAGTGGSLAERAAKACANGPLEVVGAYDGNHDASHPADFSFVVCAVDVDVDRETGAFRIADALLIADVGQIINPIGHQGQIDGGFIYGLGNAIMEEMPLDESGKVTTLSLGEYKLPTIADIPPFRTVLVQAAAGEGPFGAKAAGELGNTAIPAAVANAVARAVGVRLMEYPVTSERIFSALQAQEQVA